MLRTQVADHRVGAGCRERTTARRSSPTVRGLGDGVFEGDVRDGGALEHDEAAELAGMDEVDGGDPVAGGEHAVVGGGSAAALGVAEVYGAGLVACALLDLFGKDLADAGEPDVAEGVEFGAYGGLAGVFRELGAFGDDDEGKALAALPAGLEEADDFVDVNREFRNKRDVGSAGDADGDGNPTGVAAHDFHYLHAGVRLGGGMKAVDGLGGDGDGGVEAEAGVGAAEVIIDGLGGRRRS